MKRKYIVIIASSIILIVLGVILKGTGNTKVEYVDAKEKYNYSADIKVQIIGEVNRPGVYDISSESRLQDLIALAGGFKNGANTNINLVQKLTDGMVIRIEPITQEDKETNIKISINKATIEELKSLSGIGDTIAKRIVDYRNENGPFTSLNDLTKITGISQNLLNSIIENITLWNSYIIS